MAPASIRSLDRPAEGWTTYDSRRGPPTELDRAVGTPASNRASWAYSARSTSMGLVRDARFAGTNDARLAMDTKVTRTKNSVQGS